MRLCTVPSMKVLFCVIEQVSYDSLHRFYEAVYFVTCSKYRISICIGCSQRTWKFIRIERFASFLG